MPSWVDLAPFVVLGLVGSLHCVGMCGGFAIAVASASGSRPRKLLGHQLSYTIGKAMTYAVLGLLAARAGGSVPIDGEVLAWIAGGTLVIMGAARVARRSFHVGLTGGRLGAVLRAGFARLYDGARALPGATGAFGVGAVTGLLPCGMSWAAVILSTSLAPATAAVGLFLFGLATSPALATVGIGARFAATRLGTLAPRLVGPCLLLLGLLTIARSGTFASSAVVAHVLPECCASEDAGEPAHAHGDLAVED